MSDTPEWPDVIGSGGNAPSEISQLKDRICQLERELNTTHEAYLCLVADKATLISKYAQLERELAAAKDVGSQMLSNYIK